MSASCPSKLSLERFFGDGRGPMDLESHVESCPSCRKEMTHMSEDRRTFLLSHPFAQLESHLEAHQSRSPLSRLWQWLNPQQALRAGIVVAGLACLMFVAIWQQQPQGPDILTKGGVDLSFYVSPIDSPEKVQRGKDGMGLPPGTGLQFAYSATDGKFLYLAGIEANGTLSEYYNGPIKAGSMINLPQALQWQPKSAYERFYALFSKEPISGEAVKEAAMKIAQEGKSIEQTPKLPLSYPQTSVLLHRKDSK